MGDAESGNILQTGDEFQYQILLYGVGDLNRSCRISGDCGQIQMERRTHGICICETIRTKSYYTEWAEDYLWLPSIAETGSSAYLGIWNLSI